MKKSSLRFAALSIAILVLMLSALPAAGANVLQAPAGRTPDGYNAGDYQKAAAFLEQTDPDGVKNGEKLSSDYDVLDPATWGETAQGEPHFLWEGDAELRLVEIACPAVRGMLYGVLDFNACSELESVDVSYSHITSANLGACTALDTLIINNNALAYVSLDMCGSLRLLNCAGNELTELDVTGCPGLRFLECRWNQIHELDLSLCPQLSVLICTDNRLKELDLSHNPLIENIRLLRIVDAGMQYVSCFVATDPEYTSIPTCFISADCYESCGEFGSWYAEDGRLITGIRAYTPAPEDGGVFIARYNEGNYGPGDADHNGSVDIADALLIMRVAMQLVSQNNSEMDVNGDGSITTVDAILIMRRSMNLY